MNCTDYYRTLLSEQRAVLEAACQSPDWLQQAESHQFLDELSDWINLLGDQPEARILVKAKAEYHSGLLLIATGNFRSAFGALRSTLDLSLTTIEHSANLLAHREWLGGKRDIVWATLVDLDNGPLSRRFTTCFFPELADETPHINTLARTAYRSCSEFLHGNASTDDVVPDGFVFSASIFTGWHGLAKSIRYIVHFVFSSRYLKLANKDSLKHVEHCLLNNVAHIRPIQDLLAAKDE